MTRLVDSTAYLYHDIDAGPIPCQTLGRLTPALVLGVIEHMRSP